MSLSTESGVFNPPTKNRIIGNVTLEGMELVLAAINLSPLLEPSNCECITKPKRKNIASGNTIAFNTARSWHRVWGFVLTVNPSNNVLVGNTHGSSQYGIAFSYGSVWRPTNTITGRHAV